MLLHCWCDAATLVPIVKQWVRPGTTILSDIWAKFGFWPWNCKSQVTIHWAPFSFDQTYFSFFLFKQEVAWRQISVMISYLFGILLLELLFVSTEQKRLLILLLSLVPPCRAFVLHLNQKVIICVARVNVYEAHVSSHYCSL